MTGMNKQVRFGALVPIWEGSKDMSWKIVMAENCDEAWEKAKKMYPGVKEIVNTERCGLWLDW